jgi:hypothetical protein
MAVTAAAVATAAVVPGARAQREPVLSQIRVPHNYYYREMYLPQVTSGPSAVTWSPDGTEIIYSMAGSLWRQRIGSTDTRQLTAGPGYDFQPDWSPDGSRVVYTSYRGTDEELWVLDLRTGESHALMANGAVNLDARWSPDGTRLAFVSTAYEGRWHIFVAPVLGDTLGAATRATVDRDSHLPRYYYSPYDHYLSPAWSPDGRELLFVSNRGHVWGTGGIWRASIAALDSGREIRDEETTWRAHPDWSRDGSRIVFSSYLGQQWNQLWLMPGDGRNPLQLTYGAFDATVPRWSPDGTRIAFIVNAGGTPSLRIITLPGGRIDRVDIGRRRYLEPTGRIRVTVIDAATGRPVPARVSVTGADGRAFAPADAWRYADDSFDRSERRFEIGYFDTPGTSELTVPAGPARIDASHGLEYGPVTRRITVAPDSVVAVRIALRRIAALPGWVSGDAHVHMNYGGTYRNTPEHLRSQAEAEDVHVVENLIVNKEGRVPDGAYAPPHVDSASTATTLLAHSQEYHTSFWGHLSVLGLRTHLLLPGYAAYAATAAASLVPTNADVARLAHEQGAIVGYAHPFDSYPDPADTSVALTDELPIDVALGVVDYMEIVAFSDHRSTARVWYQLLNCGFRIPAAAGTDAMANFASLRGPIGLNRVYVHTSTGAAPRHALDHAAWLAGIQAGRTFATNGPLITLAVDGRGVGDSIRLPAGRHLLRLHATLASIVPVDHWEVVANGAVAATLPLAGDRTEGSADVAIPATRSMWLTLRAWSDKPAERIMDIYPFATTSPVYVTVSGAPVRSCADDAYFLRWIDRTERAVEAYTAWNAPAERVHVLQQIAAARAVFEDRRSDAGCGHAGETPRETP